MRGERYCVNEPAVISEVIGGETIVLNFETGHYYSLNPSATEVWQHLSAGLPLEATADAVAHSYAVDRPAVQPAIAAFVRGLLDEQLIRPAPAGATAPSPAGSRANAAAAFAAPAFEKFTDMEAMLLLDPIHEVSDAGWPRKPG